MPNGSLVEVPGSPGNNCWICLLPRSLMETSGVVCPASASLSWALPHSLYPLGASGPSRGKGGMVTGYGFNEMSAKVTSEASAWHIVTTALHHFITCFFENYSFCKLGLGTHTALGMGRETLVNIK